jgi:hypothetical protein
MQSEAGFVLLAVDEAHARSRFCTVGYWWGTCAALFTQCILKTWDKLLPKFSPDITQSSLQV